MWRTKYKNKVSSNLSALKNWIFDTLVKKIVEKAIVLTFHLNIDRFVCSNKNSRKMKLKRYSSVVLKQIISMDGLCVTRKLLAVWIFVAKFSPSPDKNSDLEAGIWFGSVIACFEICVETDRQTDRETDIQTDPDTDFKMVRGRTIKMLGPEKVLAHK